jgi:hypothetical protein
MNAQGSERQFKIQNSRFKGKTLVYPVGYDAENDKRGGAMATPFEF